MDLLHFIGGHQSWTMSGINLLGELAKVEDSVLLMRPKAVTMILNWKIS
jgi:hypothetical protein